jgi:hypothetical protein
MPPSDPDSLLKWYRGATSMLSLSGIFLSLLLCGLFASIFLNQAVKYVCLSIPEPLYEYESRD